MGASTSPPGPVSRRDPDSDALSLCEVHPGRDEQGDRVLHSAIDPNAVVRSDLGHDSFSQRGRLVGVVRGRRRDENGRQDTSVAEFVALAPDLFAEVGGRRGVPKYGFDELAAPVVLAVFVGEDDEFVRPEDRRRAGDVAEFASCLAFVFGFPDE